MNDLKTLLKGVCPKTGGQNVQSLALCPLKSPDIMINLSGLSLHVKWRRPGSKADTLVSLLRMRVLKFQFYISKFVLLLSIMVS